MNITRIATAILALTISFAAAGNPDKAKAGNSLKAKFAKMDTNSDGSISFEEFQAAQKKAAPKTKAKSKSKAKPKAKAKAKSPTKQAQKNKKKSPQKADKAKKAKKPKGQKKNGKKKGGE